MKKKILSSFFAVALIATVGFGVNKSMNSGTILSDLALANVEALANGENGDGKVCYDTITIKEGVQTRFCGTCEYEENSKPSFWAGKGTC